MSEGKVSLNSNGSLEFLQQKINHYPIDSQSVIAAPLSVGICSSDIPRCFDAKAYFYPLVIGHEFIVKILEDPTNEYKPGDRHLVFPLIPCFKCDPCKSKSYNRCENYSYYGSRIDGGLQSSISIKKWNLIKLPDEIDNISACLVEPLAVCIHATKLVKSRDKVLLYGGGFLSQIISQILIRENCEITVIERNQYKEKYFDKRIKFSTDTVKLEDSIFDASIECCGASGALVKCISLTKANGKIIQMANPNVNLTVDSTTLSKLMRKEQVLLGTWNSLYRPDDLDKCEWNLAIKMLLSKIVDLKQLISHQSNIFNSAGLINKIYQRREDKSYLPEFNKAVINI